MLKIEGFGGKFCNEVSEPAHKSSAVPGTAARPAVSGQRPASSFKINDSFRRYKDEQNREVLKTVPEIAGKERIREVPETRYRERFDEAGVIGGIGRYLEEQKPDPTVALALKTHRPLVEGERITVLAENSLQMEKLEGLRMHFLQFLKKALKNDSLTCSFELFKSEDSDEEQPLYTSRDKLEHFLKLNPAVARLTSVFNLEFD